MTNSTFETYADNGLQQGISFSPYLEFAYYPYQTYSHPAPPGNPSYRTDVRDAFFSKGHSLYPQMESASD